jgi:flavin-dependent dehydrogenase
VNQLAFETESPFRPELADASDRRDRPGHGELASTLTIEDATDIDWDVVVIGAGPAGALAARQLALAGLRTLLVDRSAFPRPKVCGGCISGLGRQILESVGLEALLAPSVATPLSRFDLAAGGRRVSLELPAGAAVSRFHFDARLVSEAIRAGASFVGGTPVLVRGLRDACRFRTILLQNDDRAAFARARLVIAADGLGRTSLKRHRAFAPEVAAQSRMGLGATLSPTDAAVGPGCVLMSVARDGYVGMVQVPGGTLNLAAAVDPQHVRQRGPAQVVREILLAAGIEPPPDLDTAEWRGTGLLTRPTGRVAARRLLVLGDAAGYIEPFTGEGMTWGMLAAALGTPLVADWLSDKRATSDSVAGRTHCDRLAQTWTHLHGSQIAPRQRDCRRLARFLRHPLAVRAALTLITRFPDLARPLIGHFWNSGKGVEIETRVGLPA